MEQNNEHDAYQAMSWFEELLVLQKPTITGPLFILLGKLGTDLQTFYALMH